MFHLPVDKAMANLITALDGESVLAFASTPSNEESTMNLDRKQSVKINSIS